LGNYSTSYYCYVIDFLFTYIPSLLASLPWYSPQGFVIVINKGAKSLVKVLVYNLGLAINLRVKYGRELNLNPKDTIEFVLEVQYKLGSIVRDN